MSQAFRVRPADARDAGVLAAHRVAMLADMGQLERDTPLAAEVEEASRAMIRAALEAGSWLAWLAEDGVGVVGGGAAVLRETPPSARAPRGGGAAYVLNVYTEPRARRRGVATALMRACLEACRARGIVRVNLHASDAGRPLYERLGFAPRLSEMELYVPTQDRTCRASPHPGLGAECGRKRVTSDPASDLEPPWTSPSCSSTASPRWTPWGPTRCSAACPGRACASWGAGRAWSRPRTRCWGCA